MMEIGGDSEPNYLRFTALEDNSSVTMNEVGTPPTLNLEYRLNGGNWIVYNYGTSISLNTDDYMEMRNADDTVRTQVSRDNGSNGRQFSLTGNPLVSGNVMSLLDKTCNSVIVNTYCFGNLFKNCNMEQNLQLPTFQTIGNAAFLGMFFGSTISNPISFGIENPTNDCIRSMFQGCEYLKSCVVNIISSLPLSQNIMIAMFYGAKNIESIRMTTISNSSLFTNSNNKCTEFIIDDPNPPTIGSNVINGLKSDCIIYVPDASVNAYKAAQYWSARANYIKGISERPVS